MIVDPNFPARLKRRLSSEVIAPDSEPFPPDFFGMAPRSAAVLLPLIQKNDAWHLLFIRRAEHPSDRHSGQVAFPGGQVDACDDSHEAAALREAEEEVGLAADNVELLGRMATYRSVTNFRITPVVGQVLEPFNPRLDEREVSRVFTIPLPWLADPMNLQRQQRRLPNSDVSIEVLHYRPYDGENLWGVTARLVAGLVSRIADEDVKSD